MARNCAPGGIADRPLNSEEVLRRAQVMTAAMVAHHLLNEVLVEAEQVPLDRLVEAARACYQGGYISFDEHEALKQLNALANTAKHEFTRVATKAAERAAGHAAASQSRSSQ